jgi:hypothetical protein
MVVTGSELSNGDVVDSPPSVSRLVSEVPNPVYSREKPAQIPYVYVSVRQVVPTKHPSTPHAKSCLKRACREKR